MSCSQYQWIFFFYLAVLLPCSALPSRHRRHRFRPLTSSSTSSDELELVPNPHPMSTPPCDVLCEAQWKSDFQVTFQRIYDTEYYEVPLDSVILRSNTSLAQFCSITHQKLTCFRRECEMDSIEWSSDRHICEDNYQQFKKNHGCLGRTARIVRRECTDVCNNIPVRLSETEKRFMHAMRLPHAAQAAYSEQNEHCHFVACHQICHEQVIGHTCEEGEREAAREVVRMYYNAFLNKEWKSMEETQNGKLFSSFCRRVTTGLDENELVENTTIYNNHILDRIKMEVKAMLAVQ